MPRAELRHPQQVVDWLESLKSEIHEPCQMWLIGSGALLLHAHIKSIQAPLPSNSMDVDPVVVGDALAWACYDACIGSEFEKRHGWHVNLMPDAVLKELPQGWEDRAENLPFGMVHVILPSVDDLLAPKLKRGEPRDLEHRDWAIQQKLLQVAS